MNISFKYTLLAAGFALVLSGCDENEWNDKLDGFEVPPSYSKVETVNYTLTAADYATIASNSTNKSLAQAAGEEAVAALAAIGTNGAFASEADARLYLPALLANSSFPYFSMNNGSSVKVTYNLSTNQPEEVKAINKAGNVLSYRLKEADYQIAWGSEEDFISGFAPVCPADANLPEILKSALPDAVSGNYAVVTYNEASTNPVFGNVGGDDSDEPADGIYLDQTFADDMEGFTIENTVLPEGVKAVWSHDASYHYMKATGYISKVNYDTESWLISPVIKLGATTNAVLTFDQVWNFFSSLDVAAEEATVNIREEGGQWVKLNLANMPTSMGWNPWFSSGDIDLSAYNGKSVQIGFCYKSTATKAGTWELKNVRVVVGPKPSKSPVHRAPAAQVPTTQLNALYLFNGSEWVVPSSAMVVLQPADYTAMGQSYGNLSGILPQELLPVYLAQKFPYAADDAAEIVVYKYYDGTTTDFRATEFFKANGEWAQNTGATTDQFTKQNGNWAYNPSVVVTLPYARNTDPSYTYYMACVNWVFDNVTKKLYPDATPANGERPGPPFIDYRNNAEFYSGASAYYGNVDVRATTAKNNAPEGYDGYDGMSDDEIMLLIKKRFSTESMPGALGILYPDAAPVEGMEVTYTINFTAYDGAAVETTIVYVVSGPGQFKYKSSTWVEDGQDADW
ncbi:choice-of-anchor J domain-containing protein [uncultured Duncaniella sp.]|uniref:choice-of-anchor J domain-containing protein n=1 Tax=uncultured Duncaniella sp. TaxID=2768039 RepID=UPI0026013A01|nr:choice-of-anchor J domain-containing protein [uncultured Duncaniella sp.]